MLSRLLYNRSSPSTITHVYPLHITYPPFLVINHSQLLIVQSINLIINRSYLLNSPSHYKFLSATISWIMEALNPGRSPPRAPTHVQDAPPAPCDAAKRCPTRWSPCPAEKPPPNNRCHQPDGSMGWLMVRWLISWLIVLIIGDNGLIICDSL